MAASPVAPRSAAPTTARLAAPPLPANAGSRPVVLGVLAAAVLVTFHLLALHEGPSWASPLLIGDHLFDLGFALALLLYALALGRAAARPLLGLGDDPLTENLAALSLGLGTLSLATLIAGFLHLYYGIVFLAAAIALTAWLRRDLAAILGGASCAMAAWIRRGMPTAPSRGQFIVLAILAVDLLLLAPHMTLPASLNGSIVDMDALTYHLTAPRIYLAAHAIVPRPDIPLAMAPSGWDLLYTYGLAAGTDTVPRALGVLTALLLGLATFALGRRHFGRAAAWLGMLLFFSTNWLASSMVGILPDFAAAFMIVLAVSDLLAWADRTVHPPAAPAPRPSPRPARTADRLPRPALTIEDRLLLRAGLLIGIAVSFKLTNLPAIPVAGMAIALTCLLAARGAIRQRALSFIRGGILAGIGILVPLAPWLLKSLYFFGSPFYPAAVQAVQPTPGAVPVAVAAPHASMLAHLLSSATTAGSIFWHYISPFGVALLLTPLVLRRPAGYLVAILLLSGALLWLSFVPLFLPPRYWLALAAIGDAATAAALCAVVARPLPRLIQALLFLFLLRSGVFWLASDSAVAPSSFWLGAVIVGELAFLLVVGVLLRERQRPNLLLLPVLACLCLNGLLGGFLVARETIDNQEWPVASGGVSREAFLLANNNFYPAFRWVDEHTPPSAGVALVGVWQSYYLDRPYLGDLDAVRLASLQSHPLDELAAWCRAGVQYMIFRTLDGTYAHHAWAHLPGLQPRLVFSARDMEVVTVQPCAAVQRATSRRIW